MDMEENNNEGIENDATENQQDVEVRMKLNTMIGLERLTT